MSDDKLTIQNIDGQMLMTYLVAHSPAQVWGLQAIHYKLYQNTATRHHPRLCVINLLATSGGPLLKEEKKTGGAAKAIERYWFSIAQRSVLTKQCRRPAIVRRDY